MQNFSDAARPQIGNIKLQSNRRILITGGAGFIGSHLVDLHLARGDSVYVVDDLSTGCIDNLAEHFDCPQFQLSTSNILDWDDLSGATEWADQVYHLAAVVGVKRVLDDPIRTLDTNLVGTRRILEAASQAQWTPRVLIASSSEVYGFNRHASFKEDGELVFHSTDLNRWSYALAKLGDEFYARAFYDQRNIPITTVRIFNTVGPRQMGAYGMVVPNFIRQAVTEEPITVFGDGAQTRSFCDVRDCVRALEAVASCDETLGARINVGSDNEISILNLAELIKAKAESTSPIEFQSYDNAYGAGFTDITHRVPDLTFLNEITTFETGWTLERTVLDLIASERRKQNIHNEASTVQQRVS